MCSRKYRKIQCDSRLSTSQLSRSFSGPWTLAVSPSGHFPEPVSSALTITTTAAARTAPTLGLPSSRSSADGGGAGACGPGAGPAVAVSGASSRSLPWSLVRVGELISATAPDDRGCGCSYRGHLPLVAALGALAAGVLVQPGH